MEAKKKANVLGILSIVFGSIGILTICGCGIGGIFGLIGIILGIIGLIALKNSEKVTSIVGLVFSVIALIFGICWIFLYALPNNVFGGSSSYSSEATLNFDSTDYIGKDYNDASKAFENLGFRNIEFEEIDDLTSDSEIPDGTVEAISIDGKNDFKKDEVYSKSSKIVISYHTLCSYDTTIKVDFPGNLIFNKYDVNIYLDGNILETLKHGEDLEKTYQIKEGTHTLTFCNSDDSSVSGEIELLVKYPTEASYKITCYSSDIFIIENYIVSECPLEDGQVRVMKSASDFKYKDYKEAEETLSADGFTKISLVPKYDIYWGITPEGEVYSVTINGTSEFKKGDIFNKDDEVKITYHMPYDQNPNYSSSSGSNSTSSSNSSTDSSNNTSSSNDSSKRVEFYDEVTKIDTEIKDKNFVEVRNDLTSKGYKLEYIHENTKLDFTGELSSWTDEDLNQYQWITRGVYNADYETNTLTLLVNTTENIERLEAQKTMEENLNKKLDSASALEALETYGKTMYPNGFKIHMLTGKLGESADDENTWFMKYKAKYKDSSGNWVECTVEGQITGTTEEPKVVYFLVY